MPAFISQNAEYIIVGLSVLVLLLLIFIILLFIKADRLEKRVLRFFGKGSDRHDLELMLQRYLEETQEIGDRFDDINVRLQTIEHQMGFCIQKFGVVRFNPFKDMGGDLSFVVALLDNRDNGVILSALHGRECCYTYSKSVTAGKSSHALSPEEVQALTIAKEGTDQE